MKSTASSVVTPGISPTVRNAPSRPPKTRLSNWKERWAAVEAIQRQPDTTKIALDRQRIEARRGRNIAKIAAARKLLTLVYYGLRDGHIRALARRQVAA